jgi:DNA-binding CsgD family transcriptional regulator
VRLSGSDLSGALDFLCEAGELGGADPFPREALVLLAELVGCQHVTYFERDLARGETIFGLSTGEAAGRRGRPRAAERFQMTLALPAPSRITRTFVLDRTSVDFGERDHSLLNLLRPHLLHLRSARVARRRYASTSSGSLEGVLTRREIDVLTLVAEGMRNRDVAAALCIAPGTVRKHLDNIYGKLGVRNRVAAAARLTRV